MSVAFRRDGDEEHLEPKFERPLPSGPNLVTPRGLAQIAAQIARLETEMAAAPDDAAREAARRDWRYWTARQVSAELVPAPSAERVAFGCRITFRHRGVERELTVVGHDEADPAAGLIAHDAPLARAMMGAEPGDLVDFGGQDAAIEILAVAPGDAAGS